MKILCLHGTNTYFSHFRVFARALLCAIFSFQSLAFRKLLGDEHEYVFIDGEIESECVIGLDAPGPYYRWSIGYTTKETQVVHDYVNSVIDDEGPFDGVLGFSEGSAIAISLLLQHEIDHPKDPPLFNFAILFSCGIVVSRDPKFARMEYEYASVHYPDVALRALQNQDVSGVEEEAREKDEELMKEEDTEKVKSLLEKPEKAGTKKKEVKIKSRMDLLRPSKRVALVADIFSTLGSGCRIASQFYRKAADLVPSDLSGDLDAVPRLFHPQLVSERVKIPTVFVIGHKDPFYKHCELTKTLFEKGSAQFLEHSGAHDLPKLVGETKAVVSAAQKAIARSQLQPTRTWRKGFRK